MPFTTFDVNIFGTTHDDLDGSNANGFSREFVIHVLQVECNQTIANFNMFIEFYAFPWKALGTSPSWFIAPNAATNPITIENMKTNGRPQVIHLDTMTPNSPVALYSSCTIPAPPCPSPADMRLFSMVFQVPVTGSLTGYDEDYTDMYDENTNVAKLPVNITIVADDCRYSSEIGTTINIYKDYFGGGSGSLFGGASDIYPIGFNEKITIS